MGVLGFVYFVFVYGVGFGVWIWYWVIDYLRKKGYKVIVIDFISCGRDFVDFNIVILFMDYN